MKKSLFKLSSLVLSVLLVTTILSGCKKSDGELVKVRLNEVTRSVFYAPMYVAINEGFFKEEGLEIELSTGQGADKTMQQLLSGSVDIGFSGPEQVIYIYNQKRDDLPILFAQLTQRDGSFLVSREDDPDFTWESVKGKTIVGGRPGGVPEMALEYVLKEHGIDITKDVELITNIAFNATAGAFQGGTGDYVALFEPTASMIEQEGHGKVVASIGASAGPIAYTCFYATKSYMDKNPEIIEKFTRAIYNGQLWVASHTDEEVAASIKAFFPGTDEKLIVTVVKNYKEIDAISTEPQLKAEDLTRLMDIIQAYDSKLIPERPAFEEIVDNSFAEKAVKDIKK
ncbi:ABC transporter substrate-binding protein [Clostridium thermarum]|uniref:ABC transporter substrate-binding protein n=1 Tax=Clostridium thermarum TaxID=1716543 RepID=UPI0013D6967E|nr:ABC transporter substrate-binding protein [Clostridium thermarum]